MGVLGSSKSSNGDASKVMEKKLTIKLDIFIMVYCCACYFFNYLDRQAFANAYVAGLREDLGLKKNEYSILLSMYTSGLVVGAIPHSLIIQKIRPSIWLPLTLILWSGLTMCSAACKNYSQLCAVRFFQGLMEASLYSGTMYVMGSWYKPSEIAKRVAIFTAIGQAGSMFAGLMMTAMHKTMNGTAGLRGWQWVFIIDGLMGIPFGLFGFFTFPDLPSTAKVFYLSEEEKQFATSRLPPKKVNTHSINPKSLIKRVLGKPHIYILTWFAVTSGMLEAFAFQGMFLLWLKYHAKRFSQTAINTYPLGTQAVAIVSQIAAGFIIDRTGQRLPMVIAGALVQLVTAALLLVRNLSDAGIFTAFYLSGTSFVVNPIMFSWANEICSRTGDDAARSVVLYVMSMGGQLLYTWWGIVLYPATDVPYWKKGSITMIVVCGVFIATAFVVRWLDRSTAVVTADDETVASGDGASATVIGETTKSG
ncbi:major facilitator superfamily domain-containing protein [Bipolaris maydis]|uniref:major facilitator superfamily domain-containing protein n=1 Tax=Cochliobolus heterostrophus TaxID=5016 RepID=UPI0024D7C1C1|nr:major facilitator superfamily domain-containing protein [Bipolaris maydis]KAJ5057704.1 major facilitator superfamily domain-containing protein [Bipolaris maydis]KAJ6268476.1 major facilitator superfamily domain-containing protein [Bipolaris maydis]KAJ6278723.1 major facilitator superfamily domain-containing protein [Bipolaris maydis]